MLETLVGFMVYWVYCKVFPNLPCSYITATTIITSQQNNLTCKDNLLYWLLRGSPGDLICVLSVVVSSRADVPMQKPTGSSPWPQAACRKPPPCCQCPTYCSSLLSSHFGRFLWARQSAAFVCHLQVRAVWHRHEPYLLNTVAICRL